jgi:hypothetical protein
MRKRTFRGRGVDRFARRNYDKECSASSRRGIEQGDIALNGSGTSGGLDFVTGA